ncbi:MAG: NAD(P)/FAD-dependent oxidoreductase [Dehalococcoidales bacterium]|nr:NAD(P)/FAD-dependent oxidoreductase [Dehalococcoidales bacterium]
MYDAIIVGGGPVGSYIAKGLAQAGYRVEVLEKTTKNNNKICCTGIISKKCYDSFLRDKTLVLKNGRSAKVYSPSGKVIELNHDKDQACIIDRNTLDLSIANDAIAAGAEYYLNCMVTNIKIQDKSARVEFSRDNESFFSEAKTVVIATGFGSKLVEKAGLGKVNNFTIGTQIELNHKNINDIEIYTGRGIAPGFFGWLVPVTPEKALVGLMTKRTPDVYMKRLLSLLKDQGKIDVNQDTPSYRGITLESPKRTYGERLIVVGDAAGQVKPLTGGGIYFGLICAEIAINSLKKALENDDFSAKSLSTYEKGWKSKLGRELSICRWAHKLYTKLDDRQIDKMFNIKTKLAIDKALLESGDIDFDYHSGMIFKLLGFKTLFEILSIIRPSQWN